MKKTHLLISSLALFATLTACGGNGGNSEPVKESDKASEVVQKPSDTVPPATEPAVVETIYEHQFIFNAPGKKIDAEGNAMPDYDLNKFEDIVKNSLQTIYGKSEEDKKEIYAVTKNLCWL